MVSHPSQIRAFIVLTSVMCLCCHFYYHGLLTIDVSTTVELERLAGGAAPFREAARPLEKKSREEVSSSFRPYHELAEQVDNITFNVRENSKTSFARAHVISKRRSWFQPTKQCTETCCVNTVAISMGSDESLQLLNTVDGLDLADILLEDNPSPRHLSFLAKSFHDDMIPCLQPGTIIYLNTHKKVLSYFWQKIRPRIHVPFIVINSNSDSDSPPYKEYADIIEGDDPLLIRWYGQNPLLPGRNTTNTPKFRPMPLGLSIHHPQSRYLDPYLDLVNNGNPFADMSRFLNEPLDWDRDVLVFFNRRRAHRQKLWDELCGSSSGGNATTNSTSLSCSESSISPSQIYTAASHFKFGISPPGRGWDCYRTYEYLYLGIIPIIEERAPYSELLFEGLPVIHFPGLTNENTTKADLVKAIEDFVKAPDFATRFSGTKAGWSRLFLPYWRRKMLREANRSTIFNRDGDEYFVGYRYETFQAREPIYCTDPNSCLVK